MTDTSTTTNPKIEFVWVLLTFSVIWNVVSTLWFSKGHGSRECACRCSDRKGFPAPAKSGCG